MTYYKMEKIPEEFHPSFLKYATARSHQDHMRQIFGVMTVREAIADSDFVEFLYRSEAYLVKKEIQD